MEASMKKRKFCDHSDHHHHHHINSDDQEEDEEEKMEKFFALIKSIREAHLKSSSGEVLMMQQQEANKNKKKRVVEEDDHKAKEAAAWNPSFQLEDFLEDHVIKLFTNPNPPPINFLAAPNSSQIKQAETGHREDQIKDCLDLKLSL